MSEADAPKYETKAGDRFVAPCLKCGTLLTFSSPRGGGYCPGCQPKPDPTQQSCNYTPGCTRPFPHTVPGACWVTGAPKYETRGSINRRTHRAYPLGKHLSDCNKPFAHSAPLDCAHRFDAWPMTEDDPVDVPASLTLGRISGGARASCGAAPPHDGINPCQREVGHDGQHRAEAINAVRGGSIFTDGVVTRYWRSEDDPVYEGERAHRAHEEALKRCFEPSAHVPYTGKPFRPEYYKPQRRNPRIDPSADASDVTHAWAIDDPRIASAVERLLRAGKKPGESLLKDLHKTMEEIHRAIEFAEMREGE